MAAQARPGNAVTVGKTTLLAEPARQDISITRLFDARRESIFRALTDPAPNPRWCGGPETPNTVVDHMDVRGGGSWRWYFVDAQGGKVGLHGVYHEVVVPERLVYTFEFEGVPGHVLLRTVTLEERQGKTQLTEQSVFQSVENRNGMLQSGIQEGTVASWDRLELLAAKG